MRTINGRLALAILFVGARERQFSFGGSTSENRRCCGFGCTRKSHVVKQSGFYMTSGNEAVGHLV